MNRLIPILRLLILTIVFGVLLSSSPGPIVASGPIKLWSGIHLGNRPGADWNSTLLRWIDGDQIGGTWPKAVVFLSSQLYNLSRDANCRIKTGANDTTTGRPVLLDYLQRASQNGVRIIIRVHPSPGNFDADHNLWVGPIPGTGYCDWNNHRPADDIADEMIAIHNHNQAHGITEWGFEPANEPNAEWYPWDSPPQWPKPNHLKAWQDMNEYFKAVWLNVPSSVHALTPPMAQDAFAEMNHTGPYSIDDPDPHKWCLPMRLEDDVSTGYGVMQSYYTSYNDGIDWHNYWRLGWENSGTCSAYALHVAYYFPQWMKDILETGSKPGTIAEADLFSYGQPPNQDPNQPLHNKDDAYGWPAANSLRKFFQKEARAQALVAWLLNDNVNDPNQDHSWHEAYNDETGDSRRIWFAKWWQYFERWAPPAFLPDVRKDFNGWNSTIVVRNNGGTAEVKVDFYDQNGEHLVTSSYVNLSGNGTWNVTIPYLSNFSGSAIVYADQDVSVVVYRTQQSPFQAAAYPGVYSGATEVHLPLVVRNWYGGQNAEIVIQNTSANFASITVSYYWRREVNDGGFIRSEINYSVPPNGLWVIRLDDGNHGYLNEGNGRYLGSAVITADQPVAAVVNDYFDTNAFESYRGFYDSGTSVHMPLITKNWYGRDSGLQIQNVGASTTHVTVRYYDAQGNEQARDEVDLPAKASVNFYRPESLGYRFLGSAVVESSGEPLVAVSGFSCAAGGDHQLHEGFVSTGSATSMALVERDSTWRAGIQVQNMGGSGTWTYLDFYYQDGYSAGSSGSKYVGPHGSVNFYDEVPSNFLGSAVARHGEPLGPMVNLERSGVSGDNMMGYSAVR